MTVYLRDQSLSIYQKNFLEFKSIHQKVLNLDILRLNFLVCVCQKIRKVPQGFRMNLSHDKNFALQFLFKVNNIQLFFQYISLTI